jgi:hypothetical protein
METKDTSKSKKRLKFETIHTSYDPIQLDRSYKTNHFISLTRHVKDLDQAKCRETIEDVAMFDMASPER